MWPGDNTWRDAVVALGHRIRATQQGAVYVSGSWSFGWADEHSDLNLTADTLDTANWIAASADEPGHAWEVRAVGRRVTVRGYAGLLRWTLAPHVSDVGAVRLPDTPDAWPEFLLRRQQHPASPLVRLPLPRVRARHAVYDHELLAAADALVDLAAADARGDTVGRTPAAARLSTHLTGLAANVLTRGHTVSRRHAHQAIYDRAHNLFTLAQVASDEPHRAAARVVLAICDALGSHEPSIAGHLDQSPLAATARHLAGTGGPEARGADGRDQIYDTLADRYETHRPISPGQHQAFMRLTGLLPPHGHILDLGAGTGRLARYTPTTAAVIQFDISSAMLGNTASVHHLLPVQGDATTLPFPTRSVDAVIEHQALLFSADPASAVNEALRVLRPGQPFIRIFVQPDPDDPHDAAIHLAHRHIAHRRHAPVLYSASRLDEAITQQLRRTAAVETRTLGRWEEPANLRGVADAIRARAWPWLAGVTSEEAADLADHVDTISLPSPATRRLSAVALIATPRKTLGS